MSSKKDGVEKALEKAQLYVVGSVAIGYISEAGAMYRKRRGEMEREIKRLEKQIEKLKGNGTRTRNSAA